MNKETEEFYGPNGGLYFLAIVFVDPNDGITFGHDNFPNNFLGDIGGIEQSILGDSGCVIFFLELDELTGTHPEIVDMPALENVSEILSEKEALEPTLQIDDVDPETAVDVGHGFKGLP